MVSTIAVIVLSALAAVTLALKGWRDHRELLSLRGRMLEDCAGLLSEARISVGADSFPILTGKLDDGRAARVDLIADTLVVRRLPQLWLRLTIADSVTQRAFYIGALARATGAEFYSTVAELPDRLGAPSGLSIVVRGEYVPRRIERMAGPILADLFSDQRLKEAVATPRGVCVIRQASEGDKASHLLLRQVRFGVGLVPCNVLELAIENARVMQSGLAIETGSLEQTRAREFA